MKFKIKTSVGVYKYNMVPLFAGVKRINKEISKRNLEIFYDFLAKEEIKVFLAYGTMLGAVREHDFIDHDEDIDLGMSKKYQEKLLSLLFKLREIGFKVCRYDRRGLISFIKDGEYIDIYIYEKDSEGVVVSGQEVMPECFLKDLAPFEFLGKEYLAPREYIKYLEFCYGDNWMTPIKYFEYKQSSLKKTLLTWFQYAKEFMPDWLFYAILNKKMERYKAPYLKKIQELYIKK